MCCTGLQHDTEYTSTPCYLNIATTPLPLTRAAPSTCTVGLDRHLVCVEQATRLVGTCFGNFSHTWHPNPRAETVLSILLNFAVKHTSMLQFVQFVPSFNKEQGYGACARNSCYPMGTPTQHARKRPSRYYHTAVRESKVCSSSVLTLHTIQNTPKIDCRGSCNSIPLCFIADFPTNTGRGLKRVPLIHNSRLPVQKFILYMVPV